MSSEVETSAVENEEEEKGMQEQQSVKPKVVLSSYRAALIIQRMWRGAQQRQVRKIDDHMKKLAMLHKKAAFIQGGWRGYVTRQALKNERYIQYQTERMEIMKRKVLKLQSVIRGHFVRSRDIPEILEKKRAIKLAHSARIIFAFFWKRVRTYTRRRRGAKIRFAAVVISVATLKALKRRKRLAAVLLQTNYRTHVSRRLYKQRIEQVRVQKMFRAAHIVQSVFLKNVYWKRKNRDKIKAMEELHAIRMREEDARNRLQETAWLVKELAMLEEELKRFNFMESEEKTEVKIEILPPSSLAKSMASPPSPHKKGVRKTFRLISPLKNVDRSPSPPKKALPQLFVTTMLRSGRPPADHRMGDDKRAVSELLDTEMTLGGRVIDKSLLGKATDDLADNIAAALARSTTNVATYGGVKTAMEDFSSMNLSNAQARNFLNSANLAASSTWTSVAAPPALFGGHVMNFRKRNNIGSVGGSTIDDLASLLSINAPGGTSNTNHGNHSSGAAMASPSESRLASLTGGASGSAHRKKENADYMFQSSGKSVDSAVSQADGGDLSDHSSAGSKKKKKKDKEREKENQDQQPPLSATSRETTSITMGGGATASVVFGEGASELESKAKSSIPKPIQPQPFGGSRIDRTELDDVLSRMWTSTTGANLNSESPYHPLVAAQTSTTKMFVERSTAGLAGFNDKKSSKSKNGNTATSLSKNVPVAEFGSEYRVSHSGKRVNANPVPTFSGVPLTSSPDMFMPNSAMKAVDQKQQQQQQQRQRTVEQLGGGIDWRFRQNFGNIPGSEDRPTALLLRHVANPFQPQQQQQAAPTSSGNDTFAALPHLALPPPRSKSATPTAFDGDDDYRKPRGKSSAVAADNSNDYLQRPKSISSANPYF